MLLKVLIGLSAAFALYWTIRIKRIIPAVITLGMILGLILVITPISPIQTPGIYLYMGFVALAFIYGLLAKGKTADARISICLISASIFTYWLWVLNHWHGNTLLAPVIVLLVVLVSLLRRVKLQDELAILTILTVDAVVIIIEAWSRAAL